MREAVEVLHDVHGRPQRAVQAQLEGEERLHNAEDGAHDERERRVRSLDRGGRRGPRALVPGDERLAEAAQEDVLEGDEARDLARRPPVRVAEE